MWSCPWTWGVLQGHLAHLTGYGNDGEHDSPETVHSFSHHEFSQIPHSVAVNHNRLRLSREETVIYYHWCWHQHHSSLFSHLSVHKHESISPQRFRFLQAMKSPFSFFAVITGSSLLSIHMPAHEFYDSNVLSTSWHFDPAVVPVSDGIPLENLPQFFTCLFWLMLSIASYLVSWGFTNIQPFYEKGDPFPPCNYRPGSFPKASPQQADP